jgi:hypothetical protein
MELELKHQLDRIETMLGQVLTLVGGQNESTTGHPQEAAANRLGRDVKQLKTKNTNVSQSNKETTTGIPDPKQTPQQYNEAMKKYDTPDGNR